MMSQITNAKDLAAYISRDAQGDVSADLARDAMHALDLTRYEDLTADDIEHITLIARRGAVVVTPVAEATEQEVNLVSGLAALVDGQSWVYNRKVIIDTTQIRRLLREVNECEFASLYDVSCCSANR